MSILRLEGTDIKPNVFIDPYNSFISISGNSHLQNILEYHNLIVNNLDTNKDAFSNEVHCEFYFKYINSSSQKMLYEILFKLQKICDKENITVKWYYKEGDIDMEELGHEISKWVKIPFEIIMKKD